jgi:hypothetical protein
MTFYLSDKLAGQVALFDAQPSLGIVNSGWRIVQEQGESICDVKPWEYFPQLDLKTWIVYTPLLPSAMMFSRPWLERVGGFDSQYDSVDDADLICAFITIWVRSCLVASSDSMLPAARAKCVHPESDKTGKPLY